jgi:hypothetical protein
MNASFAGFSTNVLWLAYAPNAETQEGGAAPSLWVRLWTGLNQELIKSVSGAV